MQLSQLESKGAVGTAGQVVSTPFFVRPSLLQQVVGSWLFSSFTGLGQNVRRVWAGTLYTSGSHIHVRGSIIPHQVGGPAHGDENLVEKDKNPEEWWPWKLDPRNGHCATPSQWSRRKSREISGIVTENTRF